MDTLMLYNIAALFAVAGIGSGLYAEANHPWFWLIALIAGVFCTGFVILGDEYGMAPLED